MAMLGLAGVIAMAARLAGVTVRLVAPETIPEVAVRVVAPGATEVTRPLDPIVLLMAATYAADELQVTILVRSWVVLSEKVPIAVNCCVVPLAMVGSAGVTASETRVAEVTVMEVDPVTAPLVAEIVLFPTALPFPCPGLLDVEVAIRIGAGLPEPLIIVTTPVSDELQVTDAVKSLVELSA
jgi:hypothetical protein